jgi:HEPN domain-containing protein
MTLNGPDPHAIDIAQAVQKEAGQATVILFGSRATGRYRQNSDLDLLVVTDENPVSAELRACHAARIYMKAHPPRLELNVIGMTRQRFDRCRRANQHIVGQAIRYGVVMNDERPDYSDYSYNADYSEEERHDSYPDHWPETSRRIERAETWNRSFNELADSEHSHQELIGFTAQQAVENALKGWLSAYNDVRTFGHDLRDLWEDVIKLEDWSDSSLNEAHRATTDLFNYIGYTELGNQEDPLDWLTNYAAKYRYEGTAHVMTATELQELKVKVNRVIGAVVSRIYAISEIDRPGAG